MDEECGKFDECFVDFCRGTHGYMAPEVLSKGTAYDSSADWFSFGCMLYKLLKGHSPFRQHKTKDKHEIDRMTLTMVSLVREIICLNDILFACKEQKIGSFHCFLLITECGVT